MLVTETANKQGVIYSTWVTDESQGLCRRQRFQPKISVPKNRVCFSTDLGQRWTIWKMKIWSPRKLSTYKPCAELFSLVRLTMDQPKIQTVLFLLTQLKISMTISPAVSDDWDKITLVETVLISTSCEMRLHEMLRWWSLLRLWRVSKDSKGKECDPLCLPPSRAAALIRACDDSCRLCRTVCFCKALHLSVKGLLETQLQLQGLRAFWES